MYFIQAASTISHQASFQNPGFFSSIKEIDPDAEFTPPNYRDYIDARALRRMSGLLRMSLACAKDCLMQGRIDSPGAIVVGTGLGALADTEKFLVNFITIKDSLIPPTSFIQSTHNTVAGQLSLILKNHNYNMTHTQNTLSFEHALQDSFLCLDEGSENVLVGATDEQIEFLDLLMKKLDVDSMQLTDGSSFFVLSKEKNESALAQIKDVQSDGLFTSFEDRTDSFLKKNNLEIEDIDLVLFASLEAKTTDKIQTYFKDCEKVNYTNYCGTYMTNSAFAIHWAADEIQNEKYQRVLICNLLNPQNLGLTLIESCEA